MTIQFHLQCHEKQWKASKAKQSNASRAKQEKQCKQNETKQSQVKHSTPKKQKVHLFARMNSPLPISIPLS
ncbi:hypothetical protein [Limnohabitans sp.]|uniref:hypothetical protein n=1 Tax=Limnohabitans sp. TaxID=1907725 RepID=UPI00333EE63A